MGQKKEEYVYTMIYTIILKIVDFDKKIGQNLENS